MATVNTYKSNDGLLFAAVKKAEDEVKTPQEVSDYY